MNFIVYLSFLHLNDTQNNTSQFTIQQFGATIYLLTFPLEYNFIYCEKNVFNYSVISCEAFHTVITTVLKIQDYSIRFHCCNTNTKNSAHEEFMIK